VEVGVAVTVAVKADAMEVVRRLELQCKYSPASPKYLSSSL
jgi:hypothetical protein